jgi:hypothetical protein
MGDAGAGEDASEHEDRELSVLVPVLRPATPTASTLEQQIVAPPQLSSAGGVARQIAPRVWHVPQHLAMENFLCFQGPAPISRYNFLLVRRLLKQELARRQPYEAGSGYSPADTLILTPHGERLLQEKPTLQVWREVWVCSGKAKHGKAAPNCQRACGGIAVCLEGCCQSTQPFHNCQFRYEITATLSDVAHNRRCVSTLGAPPRTRPRAAHALPRAPLRAVTELSTTNLTFITGDHVPQNTPAVPPPLMGLDSAPSIKALLTRQCLSGSKPVIQASNAAAAQPEGSELNSRAVVPPKTLARTVKQARRVQRGGSMSDGVRVDRLVRIARPSRLT